jgi:type III secretory pathway component EscV
VDANLAYEGVVCHGILHRVRMRDLFYKRLGVEFQKVVVVATASMSHETQEATIKQLRRLAELMFPDDHKVKKRHQELLEERLRTEGAKSYKVERVQLGERK